MGNDKTSELQQNFQSCEETGKCDLQPGEKWSMDINVEILQILALCDNLLNLLNFTDYLQFT